MNLTNLTAKELKSALVADLIITSNNIPIARLTTNKINCKKEITATQLIKMSKWQLKLILDSVNGLKVVSGAGRSGPEIIGYLVKI